MRKQQFGFRPGPTQTGLYSHRRWLEVGNFGFGKKRNFTIRVAKTKALISYCEADLRLCFRLCRLVVFLCCGPFLIFSMYKIPNVSFVRSRSRNEN